MNERKALEADELGIVDALVQLSFLIQHVLGRVASSYELTVVHLRLLGILRDREPAMLELARYMNLDKSSVSGLVDRAERRGLARRVTTSADGRVVRVTLTPDGRRLATVASEEIGRQVNAVVESLPEAGRTQLAGLVRQILFADAARHGVDLLARVVGKDE